MSIPRPEHPTPQFMRNDWLNLNGEWDFQIDNEKSGEAKEFFKRDRLAHKIIVPFCPESSLSGIGNTDFMNCVWYTRSVFLNPDQLSKHVILHFGAVDYRAIVYINGEKIGEHRGGYTPFSFDITKYVQAGTNRITLCAYDDIRSERQPTGKQCHVLQSRGCDYTRTTGIWQTVWLEFVLPEQVLHVNYAPDFQHEAVIVTCKVSPQSIGKVLRIKAYWAQQCVGEETVSIQSNTIVCSCHLSQIHQWDIGVGNLYDVELSIEDDGTVLDFVKSYFGLRTVGLDTRAFRLNGRKVFGRWVLDQGYYPDGIYTAPSDEALKRDILYAFELGFNGARPHQKAFEPRYIYWADRLGYPIWGEFPSWGFDICEYAYLEHILPEWIEVLERDIAHPSIIGWCPFNETWDRGNRHQCNALIKTVYDVTKAIDSTRPVIDASGFFHVVTDIYDVHDYEQDPEKFKAIFADLDQGLVHDTIERICPNRQQYRGEPLFVSEYGGIQWSGSKEGSWGYGKAPQTEEEFIARYEALTAAIMDNPRMLGMCYTQLYDIEQEQNGLMTYDREFKFDPEIFRKINTRPAAIELD